MQGSATGRDYIELAWDDEHYTYQLYGIDTLETAASALAASIGKYSTTMQAAASGASITLTLTATKSGANGNRIGVYGNTYNAASTPTESWQPAWQFLGGGMSPSQWQVDLDFRSINGLDSTGATVAVPMNAVRKMRWTWAADLQPGDFARAEFSAVVANWTAIGSNTGYQLAGPASWRAEDTNASIRYAGDWASALGNYSGGSIAYAITPGACLTYSYEAPQSHLLYLGTRRFPTAAKIAVQIDQDQPQTLDIALADEDVLVRWPLGTIPGATSHRITVTHAGSQGEPFYFDFLEIAFPTEDLPSFPADRQTTLATDWDTLHSQALAPERTAWLIQALGFAGRANHYAGALWFYELVCAGQFHATGTFTFSGTSYFGATTTAWLGPTQFTHLNLIGDTPGSLAQAFALLINEGSTGVWASAENGVLTITSRLMGTAGNGLSLKADVGTGTSLQVETSGALAGGMDGKWLTDMSATPRINRAARDWSQSFSTRPSPAMESASRRHSAQSWETGTIRLRPASPSAIRTAAPAT